MFVSTILCFVLTPRGVPSAPFDYHEQRAIHQTALTDVAIDRSPPISMPPTDQFDAPVGPLKIWLLLPEEKVQRPLPTILWFHDGPALQETDFERVRPLVEGGVAVALPSWRGEHGNPGAYELNLGEVDDARAAVRWAAAHPELDAGLLFTFGAGTGGMLSGLMSLQADLPLVATASISALVQPRHLDRISAPLPFVDTKRDRQLRTFTPHFGSVVHPHIAYVGEDDPLIGPYEQVLQEAIDREGSRVNLLWLPGPQEAIQTASIEAFRAQIGP